MTREEFIEVLDDKLYSYKMEGNKVTVTHERYINLNSLKTLPPGVVFRNEGDVALGSLTSLPSGVEFRNGLGVDLDSLKTLPPGVAFKNGGSVHLGALTSLPPGVEFRNGKTINLRSLTGGWFYEWEGNIQGIDSKRLLNAMISKGIFERK